MKILKKLVIDRASSDAILAAAKASGMKTMLIEGLEKALAGITTLSEVYRVSRE